MFEYAIIYIRAKSGDFLADILDGKGKRTGRRILLRGSSGKDFSLGDVMGVLPQEQGTYVELTDVYYRFCMAEEFVPKTQEPPFPLALYDLTTGDALLLHRGNRESLKHYLQQNTPEGADFGVLAGFSFAQFKCEKEVFKRLAAYAEHHLQDDFTPGELSFLWYANAPDGHRKRAVLERMIVRYLNDHRSRA